MDTTTRTSQTSIFLGLPSIENPVHAQTGEAIKIKAKRVVKFRVAKACKDAILG